MTQTDLLFLLNHIDWAQLRKERRPLVEKFLCCFKDYNGANATTPYANAFIGVRTLLNVAIGQYQRLEGLGKRLQKEDKLKQQFIGDDCLNAKSLSFADANKLLSILLTLEDQLWAMT